MMILIANPGSSTLKLSVHGESRDPSPHTIELHDDPAVLDRSIRDWLDSREGHRADGFGIRIVHGGDRFVDPVLATQTVMDDLRKMSDLAPLHMEPALKTLEAIRRTAPGLPVVLSFDTAFHRTLPERARRYAVPPEWVEKEGVRKFGFHGLSYDYIAWRLQSLVPPAGPRRTVALHLGNGASGAALLNGQSIETTMGMTPLDGLVMGTRPGNLDPGVLLALLRKGLSPEKLESDLNHRSGLLGISGVSSDYRDVERSAETGNRRAALAVELASYRAAQNVGSLSVSLGGLDCLVFTGGIGEHSASFRRLVCDRLDFLGVRLDSDRNDGGSDEKIDRRISPDDSPVTVWVLEAREDWTIARDVRRVLSGKNLPFSGGKGEGKAFPASPIE
ncbi:acetate/propionate family kinase [Leptospirillum ferriphilum]|nr:acetate/propionate family kinase [Leptospirillum ferriphilum]AKS24751.1 hypothetical protein ABH19_06920 [Leptospirillum sp. Group II 'CF-1']